MHIHRQLERPVPALWMFGRQPLQFQAAECIVVHIVVCRVDYHYPVSFLLEYAAQNALERAISRHFQHGAAPVPNVTGNSSPRRDTYSLTSLRYLGIV